MYIKVDLLFKVEGLHIYIGELNPIELVWKDIKHAVKDQNRGGPISKLQELTIKALKEYSPDIWKKHLGHVEK